jgi:hypothetical protein
VSPGFKEGDFTPYAFNVSLDQTYGSFRTTVTIPATAPLQNYDVQLLVPGSRFANTLASQQIVVSDPRPPTALINITVPDWVSGGGCQTIAPWCRLVVLCPGPGLSCCVGPLNMRDVCMSWVSDAVGLRWCKVTAVQTTLAGLLTRPPSFTAVKVY